MEGLIFGILRYVLCYVMTIPYYRVKGALQIQLKYLPTWY